VTTKKKRTTITICTQPQAAHATTIGSSRRFCY